MRRVAVFVDAGYFWVQAGYCVYGKKVSRCQVEINYDSLRMVILEQVRKLFTEADLLRVYWYDGPGSHGKSSDHESVEALDDFKLRLGTRNFVGDQKAVDGLIIADMISLAQNKAISDAILVSGDADLTPGVLAAQSLGIRVYLLSIGPAEATSPFLKAEVDVKVYLSEDELTQFISKSGDGDEISNAHPLKEMPSHLAVVAERFLNGLTSEQKRLLPGTGMLPKKIDGKLLYMAKESLNRELTEEEKRQLREALKKYSSSALSPLPG
ncbi:MAG: NYN domain-containing protein [Magnetococcus sp. DMHC-1]|nr:NYN domain-containing protein [Magnetococcales bacterium]